MSNPKESDTLGKIIILPDSEVSSNSDQLLIAGDTVGVQKYLCPLCLEQGQINEICEGPSRCNLDQLYSEGITSSVILVCDVPPDSSYCFRVAVCQSAEEMFDDNFLDENFEF